jgi:GxxExxY protein
LLESTYQACLAQELILRSLKVETEVVLPVIYRGLRIDAGYRIDMLIDDQVIIENKSVEKLLPIHEAQLITYLKLSKVRLGFLLNWNVRLMKYGINRSVV